MPKLLALTESLCPYCLCRVAARKVVENDKVFLEKSCPTHGNLDKVLLWKNTPWNYLEWSKHSSTPPQDLQKSHSVPDHGCPYDCGICSQHKQATCTAFIEVTHKCNISCPVCFAASGKTSSVDPDMNQIIQMLQELLDHGGPCPIQLSGGEPTLRDDLPQIVALARKMGFDHIQINTNGIRLAQDTDYGQALKDAGVTAFFLQFDGLTEDVYISIRGAKLLQLKHRAIEQIAELKIGIILVPTLVKGINDQQIGSIIQFAKKWIPTVKGVHFQPMTYLGRYPHTPQNENRILIPDILIAIEKQTEGELKVENLVPPG